MKAVLISIQPKWCDKIVALEKTIEVRKTYPKIETPFKVYIYETKTPLRWNKAHNGIIGVKGGLVIGEFVCNKVSVFGYDEHIGYPTPQYEGDPSFCDCGEGYWITCGELEETCLSHDELMEYGNKKDLYGWHISNLVIYDKPKNVNNFSVIRYVPVEYAYGRAKQRYKIERAPQSWCYVEELKDA
jgi:hypothetical protein